MEKLVILGFGGHAKSVIDSISASGLYDVAGYTDMENKGVKDVVYLGTDDDLAEIYNQGIRHAVFGLGFMGVSKKRDMLYKKIKEIGFALPVIIDPTAILAKGVKAGEGTVIGKRAVVNAGSVIGKMCILNTGCIVEHDNHVQDFSHVAVGAVLCGNVTVGDHSFVGANSTVIQNVRIGSNVIIGAGSVVSRDLRSNCKVAGVPAKEI